MSKAVLLADDKAGLSLIEQLVPEMKIHVLGFLDPSSLCQLSMTSPLMRKAANDDSLWKTLYHKDFTEAEGNVPPVNGWKAYYGATKTIMNLSSEFCNIVTARSLSRMRRFWLNKDHVTCFHEPGEIYKGHEAVMRSWKLLFNNGRCWSDFDAFEVQSHVLTDDTALVTMFNYNHMVCGDPVRITNSFVLHKNRWLLVHHYCSCIYRDERLLLFLDDYKEIHGRVLATMSAVRKENCSE